MLTATIEQECSASIKHRALLVLHTQTTILNHCLITLSKIWLNVFNRNHSCKTNSVSATVTNNTKITTVYNNKHLDGGLRSHFFFFSSQKQTLTQISELSCSSQLQTSFSLSIISLKSFRRTQQLSMWINDGSLAKQSYARAFAWSNESTFQKRGYIQYTYIAVLFS
jgi:hypothetical protein